MKRLGLLLLLVVIVVSAPALAQDGPTEISVWYHSGQQGERDALNAIMDAFDASQDEFVTVRTEQPEGTYTDSVNAAALANNLPCLLDMDGPTMASFAYAGYLLPLDEYVSEELRADLLASIIAQGTYNESLYSIGTFDSGLGIWGNREYLEAAGVRIPASVEEAWTLEEFNEALAALSEVEGVEEAIELKLNYGAGEWFTYGFSPILQSFGGDLINREDYLSAEGVLNGEEAVAAMEWFVSIFDNGWATRTPADDNAFIEGRAALSFVGHWEYPRYSAALGENLVLLPMPMFGPAHATGMGSWNWGITSTCASPEGAWAVLEFFLQPENVQRIAEAGGAVPALNSALELDARFAEGGPLAIYAEQLNAIAVPRPVTPAYPVITAAFATAVDEIVNGADIQEALDTAVDTIDADIEDNDGYVFEG
jgi:multiple sugar transport system substrate-binding protein